MSQTKEKTKREEMLDLSHQEHARLGLTHDFCSRCHSDMAMEKIRITSLSEIKRGF